MDLESIYAPFEDFRKGRQGSTTETAVIRLEPGKATGTEWTNGKGGDQMVLVLEGEMIAEIGDDRRVVGRGGTLVIGAGVKHRLTNEGDKVALAFSVYAPVAAPN